MEAKPGKENVTEQLALFQVTHSLTGEKQSRERENQSSKAYQMQAHFLGLRALVEDSHSLEKSFDHSGWGLVRPTFANLPLAPGLAPIHHHRIGFE